MLGAVVGALAAITSLSSAANPPLAATPPGAAAWFLGVFLLAIGLLVLSERALRLVGTLDGVGQWPARHPRQAAVLAGVLGTLVAMYPLLIGRSVVSPAMGPVHMLYDQPPYSYGYDAPSLEHTRGTDAGATMWAIIPYTAIQRSALAQGEAPLWNRYNTIGEPLWGQGQTFILDPFHLASLLIPDPALAMDVRFIAARIVFAAGTGLMVVAASGSWQAGVVLAFVAPFVGHFTMRFNHPAYFSIVYTPWILLAYLIQLRASPRGRWTAAAWLAGATFLQIVGTTPKEGIVALLAAHAAGMLALLLDRASWSERLGRIDAALLGAICGLLLSAPHWLIFLDTLSRSWTLSDQPRALFAGISGAAAYAIGPVLPGQPHTGVHSFVLLAASLALACPVRLFRSAPGLGALMAVAVFGSVALGAVPAEVLVTLPMIGSIQHVGNTFLAATIAPLLLLGGLGVAWSCSGLGERPARIRVALAIGTFALASLILRAAPAPAHPLALLVLIAAASVLWAIAAGWRLTRSGVLALGLCAYISVSPGGLHFPTGVAAFDEILIQPRARADLDEPSPAITALLARDTAQPYRVAPIELVLFSGTQALWGLEAISGPDALRLPRIEAITDVTLVERTSWGWLTVLHAPTIDTVRGFLDMVNVRYLVTRADRVPPGLRVVPQSGADQLLVLERPTAWPRAFFVDGVERHDSVAVLGERIRGATGPFASVASDDVQAVSQLPETASVVTPAESYRLTPNTTTFNVRSTGPGLAVLSEAFVELDFQATLNGRPTSYLPVNHALKGVVVPGAGNWTITFTYRPRWWHLSWALAGAGVVVLVGFVLAGRLLK
jgi:hypothetical protein